MMLIITNNDGRYTTDTISYKDKGITFNYNNKEVFLSNSEIKLIHAGHKSVSSKAYIKGGN